MANKKSKKPSVPRNFVVLALIKRSSSGGSGSHGKSHKAKRKALKRELRAIIEAI